MNKQNFFRYSFYLITVTLIFVLFFIYHPKASTIIFGFRKQYRLNQFIKNTVENNKIDVQRFWQLREYYCPGSGIYDRNGSPFFTYNCPFLKSKDYLAEKPLLNKYKVNNSSLVFDKENILIYNKNKQLVINFIVDENEMKKAVGFFDYQDKDKEYVSNKYWLNKTIISL